MDFIESKGKTVDEAVFNGLLKMDLSIDEVDIEILDEGGGLFKSARVRLTRKPADAVAPFEPEKPREEDRPRRDEKQGGERRDQERGEKRSSGRHERERRSSGRREEKRREAGIPEDFVPQEPSNDAEKFLLGLFERMNMAVTIKSEIQDGILKLNLSGRGMGVLIGRRGETLDALQYLTSLVVNNGKSGYTKIMLDTENYRKKREDTLRRLAKRLAEKVQNSGKRVVLEPMNPYERRILHSTLQNYENVYTYSEGEDPFRSVVVALKGDEPGAEEAHAAQQAKK